MPFIYSFLLRNHSSDNSGRFYSLAINLFEQLYISGYLCSVSPLFRFVAGVCCFFFFFFFNSVGLLWFLCSCDIIERIAERTAAVLMNMIKWANPPLSLNNHHNPEAWKMPLPVRVRPTPDLPHAAHLITEIRASRLELPWSSKGCDHLDNLCLYCTSKDGLMFNERNRGKNQFLATVLY